jgi:RNA polymerase sigma-70 factor (ECF subfamily)
MIQDFEQEIMRKVTNGDTDAFEFLVKKYEKQLFIMVANLLKRPDRVEEIVQDIFFNAYKHIRKFDPNIGKFSTWLFRIARNRCLNEIKRKEERPLPETYDIPEEGNPEDDLINKEVLVKLNKSLNRLPYKHKVVFVLADLQGLSYEEIAQIEQTNTGTVKSRLSRARQKLRSILEPYRG